MLVNTYIKVVGQRSPDGKLILITVVPEGVLPNAPDIFELQAILPAPTIYTGTYPTIRLMPETMESREDQKGAGIDGLVMNAQFYIAEREQPDYMGIGL